MFRKIISGLSIFLILSAPYLRAQVSETLKAFPYQKAADAAPQLGEAEVRASRPELRATPDRSGRA